MEITLNIDEEVIQKVNMIADAQDATVVAMVEEYLTAIATSKATARLERITRMREAIDRKERELSTRAWTRDDLYDRPYRYYYNQ